jgi:hypothetical protein
MEKDNNHTKEIFKPFIVLACLVLLLYGLHLGIVEGQAIVVLTTGVVTSYMRDRKHNKRTRNGD